MKTYNEVIELSASIVKDAYYGGSNNPYQYIDIEITAFIYEVTRAKVFADIQELCKF